MPLLAPPPVEARARFRHLRAKVAGLTRDRKTDDPELREARRELAEARVEVRVLEAMEGAPPLPAEVVDRCTEVVRAAGRIEVAIS